MAGKRVASQSAEVWKDDPNEGQLNSVKSSSGDELSMGLHYMRALGADQPTVSANSSIMAFMYLGVVHADVVAQQGVVHVNVASVLVKRGEKFKFRVPIKFSSPNAYKAVHKLEARLISGEPLPRFLHVDLSGSKEKETVEFYGTPSVGDLGKLHVGVYTCGDGVCVARIEVEILEKS
jgi:axial budding pattern protein 2